MNSKRDSKGRFATKHGAKHTKLYRVWCSMKERCNNPHNKSFARYGGRGITVCEEWRNSFEVFYEWAIDNGYKEGLTIDRKDVNGNYEPKNCRWTTTAEQNRNYSKNHLITYQGETKCLSDWADYFGINRGTILFRIKQGKTLDEVFSKIDRRTIRWKKTTLPN
jgi:hypothetical protein